MIEFELLYNGEKYDPESFSSDLERDIIEIDNRIEELIA